MAAQSHVHNLFLIAGAALAIIVEQHPLSANTALDGSSSTVVCEPARNHPAGLTQHRLQSGGYERSFRVYVPRSYSGDAAVPLVLDLHASGISPEAELQITAMDKAAEENGFIVVLPAAITEFPDGGFTWNIPRRGSGTDDVAFIGDVLETLGTKLCIDSERVYATGFSGGARLASELACTMPEYFAAIGAVGGLRHPEGDEGACEAAARAVPIIAFHSLDDPVNQYQHNPNVSPSYWSYGVDEAVRRWIRHHTCRPAAAEQRTLESAAHFRYRCRNGSAFEFYQLLSSGHTWPGSEFKFPAYLGVTEGSLDATALIVRFFNRFRLSSTTDHSTN